MEIAKMPDALTENRYENMKYNRCGKSGLLLPAVSLGLWHNFSQDDSFETSRAMITRAFDLGVTHFDIANNYGPPPGSAEATFGRIMKTELAQYRDELIISTKAGYLMWPGPYGEWGSKKYLTASLDQSLKRLGLDYVDIFYSHRPDPNTPIEETMETLDQAISQGKALYAGISNYNPEQTAKAAAALKQMGRHCLIHQVRYSMLNRTIEQGLLDTLEDEGIGCIVFCPLAKGRLTDRYLNGIPDDSRVAKPSEFLKRQDITEDLLTRIRALNEIAAARGQTMAQLALAWTLRDKRVTSTLIGASKVEQVEQNIATLKNLDFAPEELEKIDQILNQ